MSVIQVEAAGQEVLDRATRMLAGIDGGIDKAVKSAMARAVSHLRTNSTKAIRERYAISAANLRAEEHFRLDQEELRCAGVRYLCGPQNPPTPL